MAMSPFGSQMRKRKASLLFWDFFKPNGKQGYCILIFINSIMLPNLPIRHFGFVSRINNYNNS